MHSRPSRGTNLIPFIYSKRFEVSAVIVNHESNVFWLIIEYIYLSIHHTFQIQTIRLTPIQVVWVRGVLCFLVLAIIQMHGVSDGTRECKLCGRASGFIKLFYIQLCQCWVNGQYIVYTCRKEFIDWHAVVTPLSRMPALPRHSFNPAPNSLFLYKSFTFVRYTFSTLLYFLYLVIPERVSNYSIVRHVVTLCWLT